VRGMYAAGLEMHMCSHAHWLRVGGGIEV
jgi:hypothetical protein